MRLHHRPVPQQVEIEQLHLSPVPAHRVRQPRLALNRAEGHHPVGVGRDVVDVVLDGHVLRVVDVYVGLHDDDEDGAVYFDRKDGVGIPGWKVLFKALVVCTKLVLKVFIKKQKQINKT